MGRPLMLCTAALAAATFATTAFADTPGKWVRYVEATGSQYVDTGIVGRWNTRIEARVEWVNLADSAFVSCGDWANNTRLYLCYCHNADGPIFTTSGGVGEDVKWWRGSDWWTCRFERNRVYDYVATVSATNGEGIITNSIKVDGLDVWSKSSAGLNTGVNLFVFANNRGGGNVGAWSKSRCYGLKIWQGPIDGGDMVLVRDFQPCMKNGCAGLYDAVSGTIFYSASGTDLVCDENSEVPDEFIEYVESQGHAAEADGQKPAYIDTGIVGKSGTTVEFKETSLQLERTTDECVIGARSDSNTRFYLWYHGTGYTLGLGYGGTYWRPVTTDPTKAGAWDDSDLYSLNYGDTTHARVSFAAGSQTFTAIDDAAGTEKVWTSLSIAGDVNTGRNLYVFARNENGTPDSFSASRIYFLKIWQDGVLVRDFRPCLKNGVAGLYDDISKRIFYSLGTPLVYNNVYRENVKAKDIVFVEYIESDGNNTLDTGVPARTGIRAKGKMAWLHEDENGGGQLRTWNRENYRYLEDTPAVFWRQRRAYLGARNIKSASGWFHMIHETDSNLTAQYGGGGELSAKSGGADVALYVNTDYLFDVTLADGSQTMEWNGVQVLSTNITGTVNAGDTLHLFSSSFWRWRSEARCYGLEIYQDGTLVRDFKPCLVDGKGMLYDAVTECLYRPSPDIPASRVGKAVLSGEEKPDAYVDYVETDGTQFIDTCVTGRYNTVVEFEMSWRRTPDASPMTYERSFLGSRLNTSTDTRFFTWFTSYDRLVYAYGNYRYVNADDPTTWTTYQDGNPFIWVRTGQIYHCRESFSSSAQTIQVSTNGVMETLQNITSYNNDIDSQMPMYLFAANIANSPTYSSDVRFYWLKIWQDGNLVRNFKPVRLKGSDVVALWDFVENKPYFPQSVAAPSSFRAFSSVGPDGEKIAAPFVITVR